MKTLDETPNGKWWDQESHNLSYAEFKHEGVSYLIGHRPNSVGTTKSFFESVDGWMSVTDRLIPYPAKTSTEWLPWEEGGYPTFETVFAFMRTMRYWVNELGYKKIYIHCDGGTHRAPTLFGMYLLTYFKDSAEEIVKNHSLQVRQSLSNPLEYAAGRLKSRPEYQVLLQTMRDNEENADTLEATLSFMPKQAVADFKYARYTQVTLPMMLRGLKLDWELFLKYAIKQRVVDFFHKLLKTPRGQHLIKMNERAKQRMKADKEKENHL